MELKDFLKLLISRLAIYILPKLIPWLAGFMGGPLGWIIGIVVTWLSGKLADAIAIWVKYKQIDAQVQKEVDAAKVASDALVQIQKDPNATKEQHDKAIQDFRNAYRDLIRVRVQPS